MVAVLMRIVQILLVRWHRRIPIEYSSLEVDEELGYGEPMKGTLSIF